MTILERLLRHDAWTTRSLLQLSTTLGDAELDRQFDLGHRTLRRTFAHIVGNMECWCDLMTGNPQRWDEQGARPSNTIAGLTQRLDLVAGELLALGKRITAEGRADDFFLDDLDAPPRQKPLGAGFVHVATHGMHHRAQCIHMMKQLKIENVIEGDALSWEQTHLGLETWPGVEGDMERRI